ncbi:hypothetical protein [Actinoplanes sp. NPDC051851]|uniref:hypothetical protein n=1 Tax=Actinoplanes sp. NPDC051851 TaxID=3154753 RepID=UPI00341A7A35
MTEHGDRLREAFATHENKTPDPAEVYAKVVQLSERHKWRRRGAAAAGGAVLTAGLVAGIAYVPGLLSGGEDGQGGPATIQAASTPSATPTTDEPTTQAPSPTPSADPTKEWDAYFDAGYDYDDAVKLAGLWKMSKDEIGAVKAEAGSRLLAGETLPIKPGSAPDAPVDETPDSVTAFFDAGYDYADAVKLADLWQLDTPYDAKVAAGKKIIAGETLPFQP